MITKRELVFWLFTWVILTLLFSSSLDSIIVSFYFATILMPVAIATSMFFNRFLVPRFLLPGERVKFSIYFFYMLIVSVYLELLVMILAFVILADYQFEGLGKIAGDIYLMTVILYLVVLVDGLILAISRLKEKSLEISDIKAKLETESRQSISIRSNRKQVIVQLKEILFIESLGDYVQIHTISEDYTTKEKISSFENRLPRSFIRVHRSFIINKDQVSNFNKEEIFFEDRSIPIGRKYKKSSMALLQHSTL